jgi:hypothetical protein
VLERGVVATLAQVVTALDLGQRQEISLFVCKIESSEGRASAVDGAPSILARSEFQDQLQGMRKVA